MVLIASLTVPVRIMELATGLLDVVSAQMVITAIPVNTVSSIQSVYGWESGSHWLGCATGMQHQGPEN